MTDDQENQICQLRIQGHGYKAISSMVGLSRDIVRNFCKNNNLSGYGVALTKNIKDQIKQGLSCANCGAEIEQSLAGRPKKFCSDQCRREWWKRHPDAANKKETATYKVNCKYCGNTFVSYGNKKRKYCSHNCYIKYRFWREEDGI